MAWCELAVFAALYLTLITMSACVALFSSDQLQRADARLTLRLLLCCGGITGGIGSVFITLWKIHELGVH